MRHTIRQGECLSSIAREYGHFWQRIWNDAGNSELRRKRHDPNVLQPGDILVIPNISSKLESVQTDKRHSYRVKGHSVALRVYISFADRPMSNIDYRLVLDTESLTGQTDSEGLLKQKIDPRSQTGILILQLPEKTIKIPIRLGGIDPQDEISGAQGRLYNLGYGPGPINGILGTQSIRALRAFQKEINLDPTGKLDEATADALKKAHGG